MATPILIRGAKQLITLHGPAVPVRGAALRELRIIADGALLIENGRITQVGPSRRVETLTAARHADVIDANGRVVLPGFVDSHTHLVGRPKRSRDSSASVTPRTPEKDARVILTTSRRTLEGAALKLLDEFVRHGTTMVEAKSGFGVSEAGELKVLRVHAALNRRTSMVASTYMAARSLPPGFSAEHYMDWVCIHELPLIKKRALAEFADIACDAGLFTVDQTRRYLAAAGQLGFIPTMHACSSSNGGGIANAVALGAASVSHLTYAKEADVKALASSDTIATLLPGPVFFTGRGRYPPARKLIEGGVAVAIATDYNSETSPSANMQMAIVLATRKMGMHVAEAISAATINGAHALRRAASIGSLEVGKKADVIILGVSDYRDLASSFGVNLVEMTMKNGQVIWEKPPIHWPAA